jgi:hypothetical protein
VAPHATISGLILDASDRCAGVDLVAHDLEGKQIGESTLRGPLRGSTFSLSLNTATPLGGFRLIFQSFDPVTDNIDSCWLTVKDVTVAQPRSDLPPMPPGIGRPSSVVAGLASIDVVDGFQAESVSPQERYFQVKVMPHLWIRGWAFDDKRKTTPVTVLIELAPQSGGSPIFISAKRVERKDVQQGFKHTWAGMSGFETDVLEQSNIPRGTYEATVWQADSRTLVATPFYGVQRVTIRFE